MYEIKRAERIQEQLTIGEDTFIVSLKPWEILGEFLKRQTAIVRVYEEIRKTKGIKASGIDAIGSIPEDTLARYGDVVTQMLLLIFGEEDMKRLINIYEDDYSELILDMIPFIQTKIWPALKAYRDRRQVDNQASYLPSRKERRARKRG